MERAALANLADVATALSPHINQKVLVNQGGDKEKQIGELNRTGRKSLTLPTVQKEKEEVTDVECEKWAIVVPTYTLPQTTTSNPPPPPPYPSTIMREEEDMEQCSGVYSTIQDNDIINIP